MNGLPLAGGTPTTIASDQREPTGIAVKDGFVWWTTRETDKDKGTGKK